MRCYKILLIGLLVLVSLTHSAMANEKPWLAVLKSDDNPAYEQPLEVFEGGVQVPVHIYTLERDIRRSSAIRARILSDPPVAIFALGAKAAYAAKLWTVKHQEIPVIFAMVLNWQKYRLLEGASNMAGISSEVNPGIQFLSLSLFAPAVKKIGVVYSADYSQELVVEARKATEMLGIELIAAPITSAKQFRLQYKELAEEVDGIWVLNDPVTYTLENMDWLQDRCIRDQKVCLGQSSNLAENGLLLSVRADVASIGAQAASLLSNIVDKKQIPIDIGVMEPLGTHVTVNLRTAVRIGLKLNKQALGMATEVIE